jgi:hypothetical protein
LSKGRQFVALCDAALYITKLPRRYGGVRALASVLAGLPDHSPRIRRPSAFYGMLKSYRFTLTMPACCRVWAADPSLAVHSRGREASPIRRAQRGMVKCPAGRVAISGAAWRVSDKAKNGEADHSSKRV